jgi:hypothetical protein
MNRARTTFHLGTSDFQNLFGLLRVLLFIGILMFFGAYGSIYFHNVVPTEMAAQYRQNSPWVFGWWSDFFLVPFAAVLNQYSIRYMIVPFIAMLSVLIAGAYFIKDVYALPHFGTAFHYVISSMFTIRYPRITIDKGRQPEERKSINLLQKIGGPGYAVIEPGSAAIFRHLRELSDPYVSTTHFMAPFERIAHTVDLAEQQGDIDFSIKVSTRDGIKINLSDVHYRYRIRQARDGQPVRRTINDPYPFDASALTNMISNLTVQNSGLDKWSDAVERTINGEITDFIAAHSIDYLTAPRNGTPNPRSELNHQLLTRVNRNLENSGAELLWVDVGHIHIEDEQVDKQRTELWSADWIGDVTIRESHSEAVRQSFAELGRAQAQAEIVLGIADALRSADLHDRSAVNVRQLLLARTAQLLEAMSTKARSKGN